MKKVLFFAAAIGLAVSMSANAQFGGLLGGSKSDSKGASAADVDGFLTAAADSLIRKSSDTLFSAVASKQEIDKYNEDLTAANALTDPKEKDAAIKKAQDDSQAVLAKEDFAKKTDELKKTADAKKKQQVGAAIYNFVLGALKDKELLDRGQGIISSISSNPMMVTKLGKVKDVVGSISSQMGNVSTIASGIQKMTSVVKLDSLPTKASDQPVANAD